MRHLKLDPAERIDAVHFRELFEHVEHLAQQIVRLPFAAHTSGVVSGMTGTFVTQNGVSFVDISAGWAVDSEQNVVEVPSVLRSVHLAPGHVAAKTDLDGWCTVARGTLPAAPKFRVKWDTTLHKPVAFEDFSRLDDSPRFVFVPVGVVPPPTTSGEPWFKTHRLTWPLGSPLVETVPVWTQSAPSVVAHNGCLFDWLTQVALTLRASTGKDNVTESPAISIPNANAALTSLETYYGNYETLAMSSGHPLVASPSDVPAYMGGAVLFGSGWLFDYTPAYLPSSVEFTLNLRDGDKLVDIMPYVDAFNGNRIVVELIETDPAAAASTILASRTWLTTTPAGWGSLTWIAPAAAPHLIDVTKVYRIKVTCQDDSVSHISSINHIRLLRTR